jgi:hypothetical protein
MSVTAVTPGDDERECVEKCVGCKGSKGALIAAIVSIGNTSDYHWMYICEACGRDIANAIGAMCLRDGGWSKLEPRKRRRSR